MLGGLKTTGNIWISSLFSVGIQSNCHLSACGHVLDPDSLLSLVFFLSPDCETQCLVPLGLSSEGAGSPQWPSCVTECVFSCPANALSRLSAGVRCMCQVWFTLGQFVAEKHGSYNSGCSLALPILHLTFLQFVSCLLAWAVALSLLAVSEGSCFPLSVFDHVGPSTDQDDQGQQLGWAVRTPGHLFGLHAICNKCQSGSWGGS